MLSKSPKFYFFDFLTKRIISDFVIDWYIILVLLYIIYYCIWMCWWRIWSSKLVTRLFLRSYVKMFFLYFEYLENDLVDNFYNYIYNQYTKTAVHQSIINSGGFTFIRKYIFILIDFFMLYAWCVMQKQKCSVLRFLYTILEI